MKQTSLLRSEGYIHALMVINIILAASSFPVGAAITNALSPEILMFLRFLLAAILFAPFVFVKNGMKLPSIASFLRYLFLSLPLVLFFWCMFESLRYTSVLNTGALYTILPAITAICAFVINREKVGKIRSIGLISGTIGALWIVFRGSFEAFIGLELNYGDLIFFVGCLFLGLYNPLVKRFYRDEPMEVMTFWILLSGSAWLLIASGGDILTVDWNNIEGNVYVGIFYLSLFSTLITFFLLNFATIRIGPTKVAAYGFLTPLFVIFISILLGIERFEWNFVPGLLLITTALMIIQKNRSEKYATPIFEEDS